MTGGDLELVDILRYEKMPTISVCKQTAMLYLHAASLLRSGITFDVNISQFLPVRGEKFLG